MSRSKRSEYKRNFEVFLMVCLIVMKIITLIFA